MEKRRCEGLIDERPRQRKRTWSRKRRENITTRTSQWTNHGEPRQKQRNSLPSLSLFLSLFSKTRKVVPGKMLDREGTKNGATAKKFQRRRERRRRALRCGTFSNFCAAGSRARISPLLDRANSNPISLPSFTITNISRFEMKGVERKTEFLDSRSRNSNEI